MDTSLTQQSGIKFDQKLQEREQIDNAISQQVDDYARTRGKIR